MPYIRHPPKNGAALLQSAPPLVATDVVSRPPATSRPLDNFRHIPPPVDRSRPPSPDEPAPPDRQCRKLARNIPTGSVRPPCRLPLPRRSACCRRNEPLSYVAHHASRKQHVPTQPIPRPPPALARTR